MGIRLDLYRRQADILRPVALEEEEQQRHPGHHRRAGIEGRLPAVEDRIGPPAGEGRRHQSAEGIAGAPEAHDPATHFTGKEAAEVLAQPRPAGGLGKPLDQHAGSENGQGGEGPHHRRGQRRDDQAAQHHHARPEAVGQHAPGELPHRVGGEVEGIEIGHVHLVEREARVFGYAELGDGKGLAGEVERGVGQPGDGEDLQAPTAQ
ncbi:hypothetical protein D3C84_277890 [compost metagenome]